MASSSNPIADAATTTCNYYDAFINHRGSDVKHTLATLLYQRLLVHNLRPFLDKYELQQGDSIPAHIKGAIQCAPVHIAIFSPRYAESTWCLNELLLMLDSRKPIIPIFYGVQPSDLRRARVEDGVYGLSLRDLKEKTTTDFQTGLLMPRYDTDIVGKWKEALFQVADILGFNVEAEACNNDDLNRFVDQVVERVLKKLPKTPLNVSKYPTGLDDKIKDFQRTVLLSQQSVEKSRVVGIVGLGGVGKTTLAKDFFNRERSNYDRPCFLNDVRSSRSLNSLQSKLLKELTGSIVQINSTAEGIEELRRRVSSCYAHALIILDDVDHVRQLDALVDPVKDTLCSRSLILVTSRNKDVLTSFGIVETSIYKLQGLNPQHSQELFCSHAFGQPHPLVGYDKVVGNFLDACQGLPLSLQVIGALLCGQHDLQDWEEQLHKISRIPPHDIQSVLKISYDGLDEEEKQMFLDIACFFLKEGVHVYVGPGVGTTVTIDTDTIKRIWDGSDWGGSLGLRKLQNRCLVDVEGEYLRMHDHVRDLGRDLAEKEPLGGHRLWRRTENLPHRLSDQSAVRGINYIARRCIDGDQNPLMLGNRSKSISRLELLRTEGDCLEDILSRVQSPEHLKWLSCYDFPYASLPRWIPMKSLAVLQLQGRKLRSLWGDFKAPLKLRELVIRAPLLKLPKSIEQLKYLEKIVVGPPMIWDSEWGPGGLFVNLKSLPDEFCHLQCLKYLELHACSKLQSLPESFGNLKNLKHLNLSGCSKLRALPNSFGNLINLEYLCLIRCSSLTMSSDTLGKIFRLKYIDMEGCEKIEVLPRQIMHQRYLEKLSVGNTKIKGLPSAVGDLRNLVVLYLGGLLLETLPAWLGCLRSLETLMISSSERLKHLPDSIRELTELVEFSIDDTGLELLPPCIMALNNLKTLWVGGGSFRELPFKSLVGERETVTDSTRVGVLSKPDASVECMRGLKDLFLCRIKISEVAFCKDVCPNLRHLSIDYSDIVEIGTLPYLLKELKLNNCPKLKKVEGLCGLGELQKLEINSCGVEELSGHATLQSLETLNVYQCAKLRSIVGLQQLTKLRVLEVSECPALEELSGIKHLMSLRRLYVYRCPNLQWGEGVVEHLCQRQEEGLLDWREEVPVFFGWTQCLKFMKLDK